MKTKRVLVALGWYDYRLHRGIERYAQEHGWLLSANSAREKVIPWGWDGDGVLAWSGTWNELGEFVDGQKRPTVDFSLCGLQLKLPRVMEDHARAAQLVADHFASSRLTNFIFYSDSPNWVYEERGRGFVEALRRIGHPCTWLRWDDSAASRKHHAPCRAKQTWLATQLRKAAKPVGLFAADDQHALDALAACEDAGLSVPDQVAIVGAGNCLLANDTMRIPISSVDTNLETLGYRGAELLDHLMNGGARPAAPIRIPPAGLVARKSSDLLTVRHHGVARGLRYMLDHFHEPITIKDVVSAAAMSRRGLHKAFLENLDRTPGKELQRLRIQKAKQLLLGTTHKVYAVAEMCGYPSANTFCISFRQTTGLSPKCFRDGNAGHQSATSPSAPLSTVQQMAHRLGFRSMPESRTDKVSKHLTVLA